MLALEGHGRAEQAGFRIGGEHDRDPVHPLLVAALGGEPGGEGRRAQQRRDPVGEAAGDRHAHRAVGEGDVAGGGAEAAHQ